MKQLLLIGILWMLPLTAFADGNTHDSDARFKEGVELLKQGKQAEAKEKFLQSLALYRGAPVLMNLVLTEATDHPDAALRYLREWMAHPGAPPAKVESAKREILPVLEAKTGRVDIEANPGEPITMDGKQVGTAPMASTFDVMPGRHTIGCRKRTVEVLIPAGKTVTVELADAAPTSPVPKTESGNWLLPGTLAGLGVIGVSLGAVGSGLASGSDTLTRERSVGAPCATDVNGAACRAVSDAADRTSVQSSLALTGWILGGGFLTAAVIATLAIEPWKERTVARVRLIPAPMGAALTGTF